MIYTAYEMIRDCRADRAEGWAYFVSNYVPVIRKLLEHYGAPAMLDRVLTDLRRPDALFQSLEPVPERWFIAELRQKLLAQIEAPEPEIAIDLETVAAALEPLTLLEKQASWLETMRYTAAEAGPILRMSPDTVQKIRDRAAELIRGKAD
ncbi:MAG TPA: hypothetical protein VJ732_12425, partial [Bryobacteraceae bacterium]|nr:hypothetical protein [Bryobacteraceae bacterium]